MNHDAKQGASNLYNMSKDLGQDNVRVNLVKTSTERQDTQAYGVANMEDLSDNKESEESRQVVDDLANIYSIKVNKIPIGQACSPY